MDIGMEMSLDLMGIRFYMVLKKTLCCPTILYYLGASIPQSISQSMWNTSSRDVATGS